MKTTKLKTTRLLGKAVLLVLLALLVLTSVASAAGIAIDWSVLSGGGGALTDGAGMYLEGTIGAPVSGAVVQADSGVCAGFWCGLRAWRQWLRLPLILGDY
jgi:hypothetical protein